MLEIEKKKKLLTIGILNRTFIVIHFTKYYLQCESRIRAVKTVPRISHEETKTQGIGLETFSFIFFIAVEKILPLEAGANFLVNIEHFQIP